MRYDPIFRYRGWDRIHFKKQKGYAGFVNDHHIIPKQHRNHPVIKDTKYDINSNFNLIIMPTKDGVRYLNLHPCTIYHSAHPKYNKYVKEELDYIQQLSEKEYQLWLFVNYLRDYLTK